MFKWIRKKLENCGFSGDMVDEEDVGFTPVSAMLGDYITKEEFAGMHDGVVAVEFISEGVVELYRVGLKEIYPHGKESVCARGLWPINGGVNTRDSAVFNANTYGKEWRAFHVTLPINAKELGVIEYM